MEKKSKKAEQKENEARRRNKLEVDPSEPDEAGAEEPDRSLGFGLDIEPIKAWDRGRGTGDEEA